MRERDLSIDAVKGIAILIVMLGHCIVWNNMAESDPYLYDMIACVQMPLFMAVSGFLAGMHRQRRTGREVFLQMGKRAFAYLVPFFVWPLLLDFMHPVQRIKELLFQLDTGLWFLMTLFIVTILVMIAEWISYLVKKGQMLIFFAITIGFYLGFFVQARVGNTFLSPSLTVNYMPFYVAAYSVTAFLPQISIVQNLGPGFYRGLAIVCGVSFVAMCVLFDMQAVANLKQTLFRMCAGACGTYAIFYAGKRIKKGTLQNGLALIGQYTLQLYVCQYVMHGFFVRMRALGDETFSPYSLTSILVILATFGVMCLFSALLIWICNHIAVLNLCLFGKKSHVK